ncbi:MAG: hypothetical protein SGJ10_08125 [Bacteroidota bacterium]|nr:hypothetical protein [Bacteroidota bacterium]
MKKNILLYPRFLQRFDNYLVKKYPLMWSIRAHYFLYYSLLSCLVLSALAMITPIGMADLDYHSHEVSISISSILAVTVTCFWIYKTVIFDKQRQFGKRKITDEYISFFLSYATLVGMWFIIFSYAGVLEFKRSNIVSEKELIEDVNAANLAQVFMLKTSDYNHQDESDNTSNQSLPVYSKLLNTDYQYFSKHHFHFFEYDDKYIDGERAGTRSGYIKGYDSAEGVRAKAFKVQTKAEVHALLNDIADLSVKYDIYNLENSHRDENEYFKIITFDDLKNDYDNAIKTQSSKPYNSNAHKSLNNETTANEDLQDNKTDDFDQDITTFKRLLNDRLSDISRLKFSNNGFFGNESLLFSSYFLLGICILLQIFKNVRWRQFIVLLVVAILLPIIYAIFGLIFSSGIRAEYYVKLCYYGTFFYGVVHLILAYDRNEYSIWNIVGIMIFNIMVLTIPVFTYLIVTEGEGNYYDSVGYKENLYIIQLIETAFFILFMLPLLKRVYERIYALPRN